MTGDDVKKARSLLGLDLDRMAVLVGVSTRSLYRWESFASKQVAVDARQELAIELILHVATNLQPRDLADLARSLAKTIDNEKNRFRGMEAMSIVVREASDLKTK